MSRTEPASAVSMGVRWATRVIAIGLEFALPALLGGYLDRLWRTGRLLTTLGAVFGFAAGMIHTLAIAREAARAATPPARPRSELGGPNPSESGQVDHG